MNVKLVIAHFRGKEVPVAEIQVEKLIECIRLVESQKALTATPWLVVAVLIPITLSWWQLKSPQMRTRELGWMITSLSLLAEMEILYIEL